MIEGNFVNFPIPLLLNTGSLHEWLTSKLRDQLNITASNFRLTHTSMSSSNNSELYNRSGASFYTLPERDPDQLMKENDDLWSEISMLEASF